MTVLVTGASGFVGAALCASLQSSEWRVLGAVRKLNPAELNSKITYKEIATGDISVQTDWLESLRDVTYVVHLAARVHVMNDRSGDPIAEFRKINVAATVNLAKQAASVGVKRFIYLSSIKVNGEFTEVGHPFTAEDVPAPEDPYGISKFEAEEALRQIAKKTGMEVVIIRPPLVYGPGVKANFDSMMRWLKRDVPLPLRALTKNKRSMVALGNLVNLITVCLSHPAAANQIFLVSDGEDLSTADLLQRTAAALGVNARLFFIPTSVLKSLAKLLGKEAVYQRLCGSLQIDMTKTRQLLDWNPPLSVEKGLRFAAAGNK
jgi:nucleoside-diphosphate-sugar epimerase